MGNGLLSCYQDIPPTEPNTYDVIEFAGRPSATKILVGKTSGCILRGLQQMDNTVGEARSGVDQDRRLRCFFGVLTAPGVRPESDGCSDTNL